jgi:hypothetical protein
MTWAAIFAAVGLARLPIYDMLGTLYPTGPGGLMSIVQRVALRGALAGLASGTLFATIVMLAERRRDFGALSTRRFALWGLGAGILFVGGANVAYAISGRLPFDVSAALWTAAYGVVGAGIGAATFRLARRHSRDVFRRESHISAPVI